MADPLSIASGIAGLAMLTKDVAKKIKSVMDAVKESQNEIQGLYKEVVSLFAILSSVSLIVEQLDDAEKENSPRGTIILECNQTLDRIRQLLDECHTDHQGSTTSTPNGRPSLRQWAAGKQGLRWFLKKETIEKLRADVERHKATLSLAVSQDSLTAVLELLMKQDETTRQIQEINSQLRSTEIDKAKRRLEKEQAKILSQFSKVEPESFLRTHLAARQQGTGTWFLDSAEYKQFLSGENSKLWLSGIPGAGKSVLSATIIEHVNTSWTPSVATAFFFCSYGNTKTQNLSSILGSIAKQLALQNTHALQGMVDFYRDRGDLGTFEPEEEDLLDLIRTMSSSFAAAIVIIDGLDECLENRPSIVDILAKLSDSRGSIKTLFTSRDEKDIRDCLFEFESVSIAASKADVRLYFAAELESRLKALPYDLKEDILTDLVDRSDGM